MNFLILTPLPSGPGCHFFGRGGGSKLAYCGLCEFGGHLLRFLRFSVFLFCLLHSGLSLS